jgi:hypothetical protein
MACFAKAGWRCPGRSCVKTVLNKVEDFKFIVSGNALFIWIAAMKRIDKKTPVRGI